MMFFSKFFKNTPKMNKIFVEAYKPNIAELIDSSASAIGDSLMELCNGDVLKRDYRLMTLLIKGPFKPLFLEVSICTPIVYFYEAIDLHIGDDDCDYWLSHKGKPLNIRALACHYNFSEGDSIEFHVGLKGGSDEPQNSKLERELAIKYGKKAGSKIYKAIIGPDEYIQSFSDLNVFSKLRDAIYAMYVARSDDPIFIKLFKMGSTASGQSLVKMIEDLCLLIINLCAADTKIKTVLALISYIKMSRQGPLLTGDILQTMTEVYESIFDAPLSMSNVDESSAHIQSCESWLLTAEDLLDRYEKVKTHPVFLKFYKFGMYALSMSLFSKIGITLDILNFNKIQQEAIRSKYHMGSDFFHSMFDTLIFICKRGYQCVVTGSMDPIFHCEEDYIEWARTIERLKRDAVVMSNPEPHGLNKFAFLADIESSIEKGDAIYKYANRLGNYERNLVRSLLNDVKLLKSLEITKRSAQMERTAPFSILLFGGSSIGKSTLTSLLFYHYGKIMNLPVGSEFKYTRNPVDPFWSGLTSTQWCVILDDIAFLNPNFAANGDPSMMEMIQVVNKVPLVPNQADLADKGRVPLRAELVIATTNTEHLNAYAYFACPLAVQRRLPWVIDVSPKPEYTKDGCMLDPTKTPPVEDGCYPDYWIFTVKRVVPMGENRVQQKATLVEVHTFSCVYKFLQWYSHEAILHKQQQVRIATCDAAMSTVEICSKCYTPLTQCKCPQVQSKFLPERSFTQWLHGLDKDGLPIEETLDEILLREANQKLAEETRLLNEEISLNIRMYRLASFWYNYNWNCSLYCILSLFCDTYAYIALEYAFFRRWTSWFYTFPVCRFWMNIAFNNLSNQLYYKQERIGLLGNKFSIKTYHPTLVAMTSMLEAGLASAVVGSIVFFGMRWITQAYFPSKGKKSRTQVAEVERVDSSKIGRAPQGSEEQQNVWHKDDYQTTTFDVNPVNCSYKGLPKEKVLEMLSRNTVRLVIRRTDNINGIDVPVKRETNAVCLSGHIYLCNNHSLPTDECFRIEVITSDAKDGVNSNTSCLMTQSEIYRIPGKDLSFFKMVCLPPKKDIRSLFCKDTLGGGFNATYISRNLNGSIQLRPIAAVKLIKNESIIQLNANTDMWYGMATTITKYGDCGSMLLADSAFGPIILGIHVLGDEEGMVGCIKVTQDCIDQSLKFFKGPVIQAGSPMLSAPSAKRILGELHRKSTLRWIPSGSAEAYGSFIGMRAKHKSNVTPTYVQDSVISRGYEVKCGRPQMDSWEPWNRALTDLTKPITNIRPDIISHCAEAFTKDILNGLTPEDLSEVFVYDDVTAVNGAAGVKYVDKINRNSSAGAPWKKGKKYFMRAIPPVNGLADPVEMVPEIMDRVNNLIETYKTGSRGMVVYTGSLKDEAISHAKIKINKVRLFMSGPVDSTIVTRKYYLSLIRLVQKNRLLFEAAPGLITQSTEWGEIRDYLIAHGRGRMVAGDYVAFDKRMPPVVILAAFGILIDIMKAAGCTYDDELVMWGVAMDTAYPLVDFSGDLIQMFGSNPSGHALTVIINSLANSLYMRYAYTVLNPEKLCWDFKQYVNLMTYGDDNTLGVSVHREWFNHTTIQKSLADLGIGYTMADKLSASVPFIDIDEVSFLKRTWRFDEDVGYWLCPLEHDSIEKMLTICVASSTVTPQEQAVDILNTAVREYFNYGRVLFEEKRAMVLEIIEEKDLHLYLKGPIPTWDSLAEAFWTNSTKLNKRLDH
jgi:hypothetical protein